MRSIIVSCALAVAAPGLAFAQETESFRLERTDSGFVRMNSVTGEMSVCEERGEQLVCRVAADESRAVSDEIGRLQDKVDALEKRVAALEGENGGTAPDSEEFEQGLDRMERFFRRFMGIVRDFEKETPTVTPDRT